MLRAAALALSASLIMLAAPAGAAVRTHRCADDPGARCGTLRVPLDRSGAVKGTIPIKFAYRGDLKRTEPILALSGGPGQAGVAFLGDFHDSLSPAGRHATVVLDQRGTGYSGTLRCRGLERSDLLTAHKEAAACARKLGARRDYYFSDDSVADMDSLRAALGIGKWSLYGVSYGTRVATLYAQRHPDRVGRLILDSTIEPDGPDPLYGPTFAAIPRVLGDVCSHGLCASLTKDVIADTARLVVRLQKAPMRGYFVDLRGRKHKRTFGRNRLFSALLTGDFDESLRAEMPSAIRSAVRGDPQPIIRLAHRAGQIEAGGDDPHFLSAALYATTVCTEERFPWDWNASRPGRLFQTRQAVDQIPADRIYPFDRQTVFNSDEIDLCSAWPRVKRALPPPPGRIPDVPTLIIEGRDDLRTPIEGAQRWLSLLPHATMITIPGQGHSVLGVDLTGCSDRALKQFYGGKPIQTSCRRKGGRIQPDGPIPSSFSAVKPAASSGRRGRTVSAAARTVYDVLEQGADSLLSNPFGAIDGGGLRGGHYFETRNAIALRNVVYVPGVSISGSVTDGGAARLQIRGRNAAHGQLAIRNGRVTGVLAGKRIRGRIRSLAQPARAAFAAAAAAPPRVR